MLLKKLLTTAAAFSLLATPSYAENLALGTKKIPKNAHAFGTLTVDGTATFNTPLTASNIDPSVVQVVVVPVSYAQIRAMYTTPVTLVPAVAGKSISISKVDFKMTTTSTAFTGGGAAVVQYHTGAVAAINTIAASVITASAGTTDTQRNGIDVSSVAINNAVELTNATAVFAAGTGTAVVTVTYSVH